MRRLNRQGSSIIFVYVFAGFLSLSLIRFAVPLILSDLGVQLVYIGGVMTAHSVIALIMSILFGLVSDRIGRKRVALLGFVLMAISSAVFILADEFFGITAAFMLLAIGTSAFEPSLSAIVGDLAEPARMGRAYGTFSTTLQTGLSAGPALGGFLISFYGFRAVFTVSLVAVLAVLLPMSLVFRGEGRREAETGSEGVKGAFRYLVHNDMVLAGWVSIIFSFILIGGLEAFFPVYASNIGLEAWVIGLLFSSQFIVGIILRIPIGVLLDKVSDKIRYLTLGTIVSALTVALLPFSTSPVILLLLLIATSVGRAATNTGGTALVALGSSLRSRGLALGVTTAMRHVGISLGPAIFSLGALLSGFPFGFVSISLVALPTSIYLLIIGKRSRRLVYVEIGKRTSGSA